MTNDLPAAPAATVTDVARLAGVAPSTVSKAMNGRLPVSADTRRRVLEAAEQLQYVPNAFAQRLRGGGSRTVGIIVADGVGRFTLPVLMGASRAFGTESVSVFLCDSRGDAEMERKNVASLVEHQADGVILLGEHTDHRRSLDVPARMPVVYAYAPSADPDDVSVIPDDGAGARLAVEHLIGQGRRRIAHISGPESFLATRSRLTATRDALTSEGLRLAGARAYLGEWSEQWGRAAAAMLLADQPDVDGITCGNDQIARGVVEALRDQGRAVPDDVAVVGFDNWDMYVAGSRPPLTSIDMRLDEVGRLAARAIFEPNESGVIRVPCELVVRDSSRVEDGPSVSTRLA